MSYITSYMMSKVEISKKLGLYTIKSCDMDIVEGGPNR